MTNDVGYNVFTRDVVSVLNVFWERLVSVLKVERLGLESLEKSNVSVSRVQRLGLVSVLKI